MVNRSRTIRSRAFTLIELMIVVAIIALLIAVLLPSLARARQQAMQVACAANLNMLFKGMFYYAHDRSNGNGYLPHLGGNSNPMQFGFWTGQICPYVKISRTRLGARNGLLSCPAHEAPQLRWVCGPQAGHEATVVDKVRSDTGQGAGMRRRGSSDGHGSHLGDLVEPVSYTGSCDTLETTLVSSVGRTVDFPRRWTTLKRPHCFVLLTESDQSSGRRARCFRFEMIVNDAKRNPDYKRHYGGQSPRTNGSNFLFADGHARWNSADFASGRLICCIDFGFEDSESTIDGNNAWGERIRRAQCVTENTGRRRR